MSTLITTTNSTKGNALLHTSGFTNSTSELNTTEIKPYTTFSSTFENVLEILDIYTYTYTSTPSIYYADFYEHDGCPSHHIDLPANVINKLEANNYFKFIILEVADGSWLLNSSSIFEELYVDSNHDAILKFFSGMGLSVLDDQGTLTYNRLSLDLDDTDIEALSHKIIAGAKIHILTIGITVDRDNAVISNNIDTGFYTNDIQLTNKDIQLNGVSLFNRPFLSVASFDITNNSYKIPTYLDVPIDAQKRQSGSVLVNNMIDSSLSREELILEGGKIISKLSNGEELQIVQNFSKAHYTKIHKLNANSLSMVVSKESQLLCFNVFNFYSVTKSPPSFFTLRGDYSGDNAILLIVASTFDEIILSGDGEGVFTLNRYSDLAVDDSTDILVLEYPPLLI